MNRWMKRRIERSRARCERVEGEKAGLDKGTGPVPTSKPSRPTQSANLTNPHKQAA
jgi:hypothetical protein